MKATGIVRRIDDLGRVVVPKELRRTMRVKEGDPLEFFLNDDGSITIKKYREFDDISDLAKEYADSLHQATNHNVLVSNNDSYIAVGGKNSDYNRLFLGEPVGKIVYDSMRTMTESVIFTPIIDYETPSNPFGFSGYIFKDNPIIIRGYVVYPIIVEGRCAGSIVIFATDPQSHVGAMEEKMAKTASLFLAKRIEGR